MWSWPLRALPVADPAHSGTGAVPVLTARAHGKPSCLALQAWCNLFDIERFKFLMEKLGLYRRLHGPQLLLRQQERQIQRRLRAAAAVEGGGAAGAGDGRSRGAAEGQQQ